MSPFENWNVTTSYSIAAPLFKPADGLANGLSINGIRGTNRVQSYVIGRVAPGSGGSVASLWLQLNSQQANDTTSLAVKCSTRPPSPTVIPKDAIVAMRWDTETSEMLIEVSHDQGAVEITIGALEPLLMMSLKTDDSAETTSSNPAFEVVWNSPFEGCTKCPNPNAQLSAKTAAEFHITANDGMAFAGSKIALLYELTGAFPALRGDYIAGSIPCWADGASADNCTLRPFANISVVRNGGVPQAADVQAVANKTASALLADSRVPANFSGLLVLDFEAWRPLSADNDALYSPLSTGGYTLSLYTQYGRQLVQQQHPSWDDARITVAAIQQFDAAAQAVFTAALVACKLTRPHARVGYYGFPGMISPIDTHPASFAGTELLWLWRQLDVLIPSDYLWAPQFTSRQPARARVNVEMSLHLADLVLNATGRRPAVFPYVWIWPRGVGSWPWKNTSNYTGGARGADLAASIEVPAAMGADGVILWGSSAGVDSRSVSHYVNNSCVLCENIQDYLTSAAGPVMAECVEEREKCAVAECSGHGRCASQFDVGDAVGICKRWRGKSTCVCSTGWSGLDCATRTNGTRVRMWCDECDF
jgi:hypothetical protein